MGVGDIIPEVEEIDVKIEKEMKSGVYSLLVLLIISRSKEPIYGYQIIKKLEELSEGKLNILEGAIYVLLKSLHNQKLLKTTWGLSTEGPPRKYYEITELGIKVLNKELAYWKEIMNITNKIIAKMEG